MRWEANATEDTKVQDSEEGPLVAGRSTRAWIWDLSASDPKGRTAALRALATAADDIPVPRVLEDLARYHPDPVWQDRLCGPEVLGYLALHSDVVMPALAELLQKIWGAATQFDAARLLLALGHISEGMPTLVNLLESGDSQFQCQILIILSKLGPAAESAVAAVAKCLLSTDEDIVFFAATTLYQTLGLPAMPLLNSALETGGFECRFGIASATGTIGPPARDLVDSLTRFLVPPHAMQLQRTVCDSLGDVLRDMGNVPDALLPLLGSSNLTLRIHAAAAACRIDPRCAVAIRILRGGLQSADSKLRSSALTSIVREVPLMIPDFIPDLIAFLQLREEHDSSDPQAASRVVARIGMPAFNHLCALLDSKDVELHYWSLQTILDMGEEWRLSTALLVSILRRHGHYEEMAKQYSIRRGILVEAVPHVVIDILSRRVGPDNYELVDDFAYYAHPDNSERLKLTVAEGLGRIGPAAARTIPLLTKLLDDDDAECREAARLAIEKISSRQ